MGRVVGGPGGKSRDKHWVRPEGGSIQGPSRLKGTGVTNTNVFSS